MTTVENSGAETIESTETSNKQTSPKRVLGIWSASSMVGGGMIGSGIFFLPKLVMVYSGSVGMFLFTWVLCGIMTFFGGLCYVELGLTFPKSGGEYILIKETLGSPIAFMILWLRLIIIAPAVMATQRLAIATYLLEPFFPGCASREDLVLLLKLIACTCVCLECFLNILSATWAVRIHNAFTSCKIITLLIVVGMGVYRFTQGSSTSFTDAFVGTTTDFGTIALGIQSCLWAYEGWDSLNDITEEIKNPAKTMPWAVLGSISMVTSCYLVVNIAYLGILTPQELKESPATAALVVEKTFGSSVSWIVPVLVSASIFGSSFGAIFRAGRVLFSAAREGHLPKVLAMVHTTQRTPIPAFMFLNFFACVMILVPSSSIQRLIRLLSTAGWFVHTVTVIGLLWTRYRRPEIKRPIKLPIIIPVFFLFICLYLTIAPFIKAPIESSVSLIPLLVGLPVYYVVLHLKVIPKCVLNLFDWISYKSVLIFNVRFPSSFAEFK